MNMLKTVLLVDDDINLMDSVTELLRTRGYFVLENSDPRESLESWRPRADDSVLVDPDMLGMDDFPFLTEVRRIHPTVEELLVTGELRWWGPASSDEVDSALDSLTYDGLFTAGNEDQRPN